MANRRSCQRMGNYHNSCNCPGGYQVVISGVVVDTPAFIWWGLSPSGRSGIRDFTHPLGRNPIQFDSTGSTGYSTSHNGPVYYGPGSGSFVYRWSEMGAVCSAAWLADYEYSLSR